MRKLSEYRELLLGVVLLAPGMLAAPICRAQTSAPLQNTLSGLDAHQTDNDFTEKYMQQNLGDPREEAAYQAFHKLSTSEADKKIKLGQAFLNKYPADRYTETVYEELAQTYYAKHDVASFYDCSDKGLQKFPNDVTLLALVGWVIPRAYQSNDPDGDKKLDQAETYEKRAVEALASLHKPPSMSDKEFNDYEAGESVVTHSALGLIYFRREKYDESAKELQQSLAGAANPDPTDLLVLGADLENLSRFKEAADAFNRCAQIPGSFQDQCKQNAAKALRMDSQSN